MQNTTESTLRAIDAERIRRGWARGELATRLDMSSASLSARFKGRVAIDIEFLDTVAAVMGISTFDLIERAKEIEQMRAVAP